MHSGSRVIRCLLLLTGTAASLTAGEVALRLLRPAASGIEHQPLIYQRDPELGYRYRSRARARMHRNFEIENTVVLNSDGFHDLERPPSGAGFRIAALGDSFTAAIHVPVEQTWTRVLESQLGRRRTGPRPEVVNLGLDGTASDTQLALLRRFLAGSRPRMVILAFSDNDLGELIRGKVYRELYRGYVLAFQSEDQLGKMKALVDATLAQQHLIWLHRRCRLFRTLLFLVRGRDHLLRSNFVKPSHLGESLLPSGTPDLEGVFRRFLRLAKDHRFRFLVVPIPMKHDPASSSRVLRVHVPLEELEVLEVLPIIQALLDGEGRRLADLYWRHDGHFNAYGHRLFARALARLLEERFPELRAGPSGGGSRQAGRLSRRPGGDLEETLQPARCN